MSTVSTCFEFTDDATMDLMTLVLKFCSDKETEVSNIIKIGDTLTKRMCVENITIHDTIRMKIIEKLMKHAPHLCVRRISDVIDKSIRSVMHLSVVVDVSGSMDNSIKDIQRNMKTWIDNAMAISMFSGVSIIFFDSNVYGPFHNTSCLTEIRGGGSTKAIPALDMLRQELKIYGPSCVIFVTDGEFDEKKSAYGVSILENVVRFIMVFPSHTPPNAEQEHYSYLPRITPPNIFIGATRMTDSMTLNKICTESAPSNYVPIIPTLYTQIGGQYLLLKNMSSFEMNTVVSSILEYPNGSQKIVHTFFDHIIGLYNVMMCQSGDLLNTLRSPEMQIMWGFLQPLKKTLVKISEDHYHYSTTSIVYDFLETCESTIVDMRDKRLSDLKRMSRTQAITNEIEEISKAFNNMKKIDEYDRILMEIERLKLCNKSIHVKFYYIPKVALEIFKIYPNMSLSDMAEIYTMIASIGICAANDKDAMELVMDQGCKGLILVLRLMTYRKSDTVRMTLTATLVTRILFGFVSSNIMTPTQYTYSQSHILIRIMILKIATEKYSPTIMSNVTNAKESVNFSPEWIRILFAFSQKNYIKVPKSHPPVDLTMWVENEDHYVLNQKYLETIFEQNSALYAARILFQPEPVVQKISITKIIPIIIEDFNQYIVVGATKKQTWQEWGDIIVRVIEFRDGSTLNVTNKMVLQERLLVDANGYLERNWDKPSRLINKSGPYHPVSSYGSTSIVTQTFVDWITPAWKEFKQEIGYKSNEFLPVVPSCEMQNHFAEWLSNRVKAHPIEYSETNLKSIPLGAYIRKMDLSPQVKAIATRLVQTVGFQKMSNDEQVALAKPIVPVPEDSLTETIHPKMETMFTETIHPEMETMIDSELEEKIKSRFAVCEPVVGIGKGQPREIRTENEWFDLGQSIKMIEEYQLRKFTIEDFTCPLSGDIFEDPVSFGGHYFERTWITQWLEYDVKKSSPLTRLSHNDDGTPFEIKDPQPQSYFVNKLNEFKQLMGPEQN